MTNIPRPQEIYRHFKGNLYQIITIAEHSETGERLVIYQALYGDFKIYARELGMFTSRVDRVKYPNAKQEYRFVLMDGKNALDLGDGEKRGEFANREKDADALKRVEAEKNAENEAGADRKREPEAEKTAQAEKHAESGTEAKREIGAERKTAEEPQLDPMLMEFLDADTYEQKLNILAGVHHRITQDMLTTMAVASDIELGEGDLEEQYRQLKTCLLTLEKYECNRMT